MNRYCEVCCTVTSHSLPIKPISRIENLAKIWKLDQGLTELFNLREGYSCKLCFSSMRTQGIACLLAKITNSTNFNLFLKTKNNLSVAEINSCANLHNKLTQLKNLTYSEYFDPKEQTNNKKEFNNIQHQDITALTYNDDTFDIVLHSETLEHLVNPNKAISECIRVLKPGGVCIFTTPVIWGRKTKKKFKKTRKIVKLIEPISYHGDLNSRYPVMYEFGSDIQDILGAEIKVYNYNPDYQSYVFVIEKTNTKKRITTQIFNKEILEDINVSNLKQIELKAKKEAVEMSKNAYDPILINDGERMVPEFHENNLFYAEHMTRYSQTSKLVHDKVVLDIACGSGYGTKLLSEGAKKVFGVDISTNSIEYAKQKYNNKNIEYLVGSAEKIPLEDSSVDVVVTFETIEHIKNYKKFLKEIKRVLKNDGLAIISTPNDIEYAEGNHHHLYQFKYNELLTLLKKDFKYIDPYFQSTWRAVLLDKIDGHTSNVARTIKAKIFKPMLSPDQSLYFYMVCSNAPIKTDIEPIIATGPHLSEANEWYEKRDLLNEIEELRVMTDKLASSLGMIERSRAHKLANNITKIKIKIEALLR